MQTTLPMDPFELPADGWYQISARGEFPHKPTGLVQLIDDAACASIRDRFREESARPNFPGVLVDFDHFSLDQDKPSEAAGWIVAVEARPTGLWAQIRWTDRGGEAVRGGRYRFISPVWKQDECEVIDPSTVSVQAPSTCSGQGNTRVRPLRLVNCALTNDPNIAGMVPLTNSVRACAPTPRMDMRPVVYVLNRALATLALANGMYFDPKTGQSREWIGGRPWGRGRGGSGGGAARASTPAPAEPAASGGEPGTEYPNIRPLGETPAADETPPQVAYHPIRETDARVKAIEDQRAAIEAQRPPEPKPPDFTQVDTRKLQRELMAQGKGTNEIAAAVKAAEAQNAQRKAALAKIKKDIATVYPNDGARQRAALVKYQQQLDAQYQKQHAAWTKANVAIDKAVATANRLIAEEQALGREETARAAQQQNNSEAVQAEREAEKQDREIKKQIEADKAEARRQAAAKSKTSPAAKPTDDVAAMSREMRKRQFYWQSIARGEYDTAETIYPEAETAGNIERFKALTPPSRSKANEKAFKAALAELEKYKP